MRQRGAMSGGASAAAATSGSGMAIGDPVVGATATRVPYIGAGPVLADSALLTFTVGSGTLSASVLQATGLTAGRVPFAGVGGALTDDADLTFVTDTLTATKIVGSTSISTPALTASGLTSGRVPIVSTAGLLADDAGLLYDATTDTLTSGALVLSSATVPVLKSTITDSSAATQLEAARLCHQSSVTGTIGIGAYQSFWASNNVAGGGTLAEAARVKGLLRAVTNGTESGAIEFVLNAAGILTSAAHITGTSLYGASSIGVGTISATGVTTVVASLTGNTSSMVTLSNANAGIGGVCFTGTVNTSAARSFFITTPSANTGITTTSERPTHIFGSTHTNGVPSLGSIVQTWANGTVALQRENIWVAPTYLQTSGTNVMTLAVHHDFGSIPKITGTTNSLTGARVARFGGSAAQGVTAAATDYVGVELVPSTITYTGSTQVTSTVAASQLRLDILTLTDASAVTIDQAATLDIVGAVAQAGSVTITKKLALLVRAGGSQLSTVGFNDTAPIAKPTVTGAKGSNAALASLMTALANYGLVVDSTSA